MADRNKLVAIGPEAQAGEADQEPEAANVETSVDEYLIEEEWVEDEPVRRLGRFGWVVPTLAVLAVLGRFATLDRFLSETEMPGRMESYPAGSYFSPLLVQAGLRKD